MKVLFLPPSNVPVKVCNHRLGAAATVSQCTDLYLSPSAIAAEMLGFKYNIAPTYFLDPILSGPVSEVVQTGRCGFGVYFLTAYWFNGNSVSGIPDYNATVWTSAGASAFENAVLGESKPSRFPNHGQELYDISNGVYGFDHNTGVAGTNNLQEATVLADYFVSEIESQIGKTPSVMSYQNGELGISMSLINHFLAGRNSDSTYPNGDGRTAYGFDKYDNVFLGTPEVLLSKEDRISQASTTRFWDSGRNLSYIGDQVEKTILNQGWYNDFIHYHSAYNSNTFNSIENFYSIIDTTIGEEFVWRTGYEEAMEYMFLREGIHTTIGYEKNNKVSVFLHVTDLLAGFYEMINTPISIEVDLSTTYLAEKFIKSNYGSIKNLGADKYIIEVLLTNLQNGVFSIILEESDSADYINLNKPTASYTVNGSEITVTTDLPTKAILFSCDTANEYNANVVQRLNELALTHVFSSEGQTGNLKVGVITEFKQSILISI